MLRRAGWGCAALAVTLVAFQLFKNQPASAGKKPAASADSHSTEWVRTGGDYAETRYSPLSLIDTTNVNQLGLAWYYDTGSEPGALEATPIEWNGTVFASLTWDVVFAVDARTGKLRWRYDPHISHHNFANGSANNPQQVRTGPTNLAPVNRGVALYDGKIYVGLLDGRLIALDAETGKLVWSVQTTDPSSDYSVTGVPRIAGGKVVIGNAGADYATRGYVTAYDAETGKQIWRTYTIPGDPSKPSEDPFLERAAKTWTGDWWKLGGGGNAWNAFAYDPDLNLIYFGTANGSPWDQNWRSPSGGDNLYVCSIIAVHADTGKYAWYFQETPGDEWDYDATEDLILADVKIGGELQKVIMQASKNGFFYVLDRRSGHFLSARPFAYVTWAAGLDPATGRPIEAPGTLARYDGDGTFISPSNLGAHNWPAMSFNPGTGLAYIPANNNSFFFQEERADFIYQPGWLDTGLYMDRYWPPRPSFKQRNTTPPPDRPAGSYLVAWDPTVQKEAWQVPDVTGSTMTTGGTLVFCSTRDGHFAAFSADKGQKLWQVQLDPGTGSPITYMLDGKQYVSVLAGRSGDGRLYTFAVGEQTPMPTSSGIVSENAVTTLAGVYKSEQAERGKTEYLRTCAACHQASLGGQGAAPALAGGTFKQEWAGHTARQLFEVITKTMPQGNPGSLSAETYGDILSYILKANDLPPGPHELRGDPEELQHITLKF
jgi:quinohemoprotein ethanol dehydrogenase